MKGSEQLDHNIDLHIHTTVSDGTYTAREVVRLAADARIKIIAITDHDTVEGLEDARDEADKTGLRLINGLEISSKYKNGSLHILGYGINHHSTLLKDKLKFCQEQRKQRNAKIVRKLQDAGIDIDVSEIIDNAGSAESLGRPHIADVLLKKGHVKNINEAFQRFLGAGGIAFVNKEVFSAQESIDIIKKSGGTAFLAHPKTLNRSESGLITFIEKLKHFGLEGIELFSSYHSKEDIVLFDRIRRNLDLKISAGSDFHGANKPEISIGRCNLGETVTLSQISSSVIR